MSVANCSFCNAKEEEETPLCQSCGALRYPIANNPTQASRHKKIKLSAALAVTLVTPGSFVVLALVGANKIKKRNS